MRTEDPLKNLPILRSLCCKLTTVIERVLGCLGHLIVNREILPRLQSKNEPPKAQFQDILRKTNTKETIDIPTQARLLHLLGKRYYFETHTYPISPLPLSDSSPLPHLNSSQPSLPQNTPQLLLEGVHVLRP